MFKQFFRHFCSAWRPAYGGRALLLAFVLQTIPPLIWATGAPDLYAQAVESLQAHRYQAAIIQLKNLLREYPEHAEGRAKLGAAYFDLGLLAEAQKELGQARAAGAPRKSWAAALARAHLGRKEYAEALAAATPDPGDGPALTATLLAIRGQVFAAQDNREVGGAEMRRALEMDPQNVDALIALASLALAEDDLDRAVALLEQARALAPDDPLIWRSLGYALRQSGKHEEALKAFEKAAELVPGNSADAVGRIVTLLSLKRWDEARAALEALPSDWTRSAMGRYLQGLVELGSGNIKAALENLEYVLGRNPDQAPLQFLLASIYYGQGRWESAAQLAESFHRGAPQDGNGAKLLAAIYLQLQRPGEAVEVLERVRPAPEGDPRYLALLGEARVQLGDYASGIEILQQAAATAPEAAGIRSQLALSQLMAGDTAAAIGNLEQAIKMEKTLTRADELLARIHLREGSPERALRVIQGMKEKRPGDPSILNFEGMALLQQGNRAAARAAFEAALQASKEYVPAALNLAGLALAEGDLDSAERLYLGVLAQRPDNDDALLGRVEVAARRGDKEAARRRLEQAHDVGKGIRAGLRLADAYLAEDKPFMALAIARELMARQPRSQAVLLTLGIAQLRAGEAQNARLSFEQLVSADPEKAGSHYWLSRARAALGDQGGAAASLDQALDLDPQFLPALEALAERYQDQKEPRQVLAVAKRIQSAHPADPEGYRLEALARTALGEGAAAALADTKAEAASAVESFRAGETGKAIERYQHLLEAQPDNVLFLNNLAWLYAETGQTEQALRLAATAYRLAPDQHEVVDTFGWIQVTQGDKRRGLQLAREAASLAPQDPLVRYHLAAALAANDQAQQAVEVLAPLLKEAPRFEHAEEARALLKSLQGRQP